MRRFGGKFNSYTRTEEASRAVMASKVNIFLRIRVAKTTGVESGVKYIEIRFKMGKKVDQS
jgi:hypothetical protein